jgi:hypothetical protein
MRTFRELLVAALVGGALGFVFAAGIAWERVQTELDYSQAKGQCSSTMDKTRYAAKDADGWVCFIQHWEDKRKPRITMSRLTIE